MEKVLIFAVSILIISIITARYGKFEHKYSVGSIITGFFIFASSFTALVAVLFFLVTL